MTSQTVDTGQQDGSNANFDGVWTAEGDQRDCRRFTVKSVDRVVPVTYQWKTGRPFVRRQYYLVFSVLCYFLRTSNGAQTSLLREGREHDVQRVWEQLSPTEVSHIFGHDKSKNSPVPNLDIVSPQLKLRHNQASPRFTRSISTSEEAQVRLPPQAHISLHGLGHNFDLNLMRNSKLIDDKNFVYLFRDGNGSKIISEDSWRNQLQCFYHGRAKTDRDNHHHKDERGRGFGSLASLNICKGITGFITPEDGTNSHYYVIHPVPERLHGSRFHNDTNDSINHLHHFMWRRDRENVQENQGEDSCPHSQRRMNRVKRAVGRRYRRGRSNDAYSDYTYRPRSIPTDSYWLQHRTTFPTPIRGRNVRKIRQQTSSPSGESTEFHWSEAGSTVAGAAEKPALFFYEGPSRSRKPEQVVENVFSANPSENLPFLTRRTDGDDIIVPRQSKAQLDVNERDGYHWSDFNVEETREDNARVSSFYSRARNGTLARESQDAHWVTLNNNDRKGRNDAEVFGENWKSSLDSELKWTQATAPPDVSWSAQRRGGVAWEPAHLTIETAVFIDKDLYKHMESNFPEDTHGEVTRIVLAMINAVQLLYQDPSLGHRVDFVLKRLEVLASDPVGLIRPYDIDRFLTNFCKWQKTENPVSDADPLHWDHALILTGLDLYVVHQSGKISNQVVGLAPVAGMCTRSSSCTVNEGRHFESVYVVAHEIGHNLGMRHDGPQADNECDPSSHIMSPTLGSGKITWSPCSKRYLDLFLETSQSKCLLDRAKSESRLDHDADGRLPGERFDADRQCVLKYGRGSYHAVQQPLEDVCRDLHCRREHYTWTSHPALEGTFCGIEMWCRSGKCVAKANSIVAFDHTPSVNSVAGSETAAYSSLKAMNGGWGKWSPFTDCSSACLTSDDGDLYAGSTGIRLAARRCDSPRPENGGRQCEGLDRRYKTCDTTKVCSGSASRPKTTEYANEVCSRAAAVDTELTGRGYMTNTNDPERACAVWCETSEKGGSRSRGWSFPDGTACKLISSPDAPTYCIAGSCQEFSCSTDAHYRLSDEDCSLHSKEKDANAKSWFSNRLDITGVRSLSIDNHRSGKSGWTDWESQSECKLACLAPSKGLELVKRNCNAGENQCSGLALSVRLCKPSSATALPCNRLQTPFEYATKVCGKYSEKISGLSGIGMQLSPTDDDKDRPCKIGCQDEKVPYRFYMVNGEEGWFPAGTDCSRGDPSKKSYCMGGKCIEFGQDDTPNYRITQKLMGSLGEYFQERTKRQAVYDVMDHKSTSFALDQGSLRDLVDKFPRQDRGDYSPFFGQNNGFFQAKDISQSSLDFSRPITVNKTATGSYMNSRAHTESHHGQSGSTRRNDRGRSYFATHSAESTSDFRGREMTQDFSGRSHPNSLWPGGPIEGSFYEWRMIVSDCSVSCGKGVQETIVECVSGDTVVSDNLCSGRTRPGVSGYSECYKSNCEVSANRRGEVRNSLWNWVQSLLPAGRD